MANVERALEAVRSEAEIERRSLQAQRISEVEIARRSREEAISQAEIERMALEKQVEMTVVQPVSQPASQSLPRPYHGPSGPIATDVHAHTRHGAC